MQCAESLVRLTPSLYLAKVCPESEKCLPEVNNGEGTLQQTSVVSRVVKLVLENE